MVRGGEGGGQEEIFANCHANSATVPPLLLLLLLPLTMNVGAADK